MFIFSNSVQLQRIFFSKTGRFFFFKKNPFQLFLAASQGNPKVTQLTLNPIKNKTPLLHICYNCFLVFFTNVEKVERIIQNYLKNFH